ncbi:hypothetical protein OYC64_021130 [Pagothenia borchgrevinki]|uniref:Uncharacterized protein n=1 Tax=Pagothenia borchgrevinki TaxID=8213 RepID=A0ABD2FZ02_PAGBO
MAKTLRREATQQSGVRLCQFFGVSLVCPGLNLLHTKLTPKNTSRRNVASRLLRLGHVSHWNTPQRLQPTAK